MSLCINPDCSNQKNSDDTLFCQSCSSELLLKGRYRTIKELGQGGFGKTYEVRDVRSNTRRVLKILTNNEPKAVELFQREAEVLKMLDSPGIPTVEPNGYFVYFPRDKIFKHRNLPLKHLHQLHNQSLTGISGGSGY
ncbi:MAG: hypothetical protein QNJ51_05805 [Calothrix sp. MO_167.B12]|nr:hypothetical protein [Calothrix sp. MO_167.B12]